MKKKSKKRMLRKAMITERTLIMATDVSQEFNIILPMDYQGAILSKPFKVKNNAFSYRFLDDKVKRLLSSLGKEKVLFAFEPTGPFYKPFAYFLKSKGYPFVLVNPQHVSDEGKKADNTPTKNDSKDAYIIGLLVSEGKFFSPRPFEGVFAELQNLSRLRASLQKEMTRKLNQMRALFSSYFPEILKLFSTLKGKTFLMLAEKYPFPQDILKIGEKELELLLKKHSRGRLGALRAKDLILRAKDSIGIPYGAEAARLRLSFLVFDIRTIDARLKALEKEIEKALEITGYKEALLSIKGIGIVSAASFLGELGDPSLYSSYKEVVKLSGYDPKEKSSGKKRSKRKISKTGITLLRAALGRATIACIRQNEVFRLYYRRKLERPNYVGRKLEKAEAVCATTIKLIKVLFSLLKSCENQTLKLAA